MENTTATPKPPVIAGVVLATMLIICVAFASIYESPAAREGRAQSRADRCLSQKDYAGAIQQFQEAIRVNPEGKGVRDTRLALAVAFAHAGRRAEAFSELGGLASRNDRVGAVAQKMLSRMQKNPQWPHPK